VSDRIPGLARKVLEDPAKLALLPARTVELLTGIEAGQRIRGRASVVAAAELLVYAHGALGLDVNEAPRSSGARLHPTRRVSLERLQYFTTPGSTPGQELAEHVRRELGLDRVPGVGLAKIGMSVPVNPVTLEQLSLSRIDHELLIKYSRAFGLAAARGDDAVEKRLFKLGRSGPPYADPALPPGVALFHERDEL
jgi:hypothetical protein